MSSRLRSLMGRNIKKFRKDNSLTQASLAEMIDSSTSYIGEIEIGKKFPSPENIEKLAESLNVEPFELLMDLEKNLDSNFILKTHRLSIMKEIEKVLDKYTKKE